MARDPLDEDRIDTLPGERVGVLPADRSAPPVRVKASTDPNGRSADEIEDDIERTRSQMDDTLSTLQRKLSPSYIGEEVMGYLRGGGATEFMHNLGESVKRNPVPVTLVGVGLAWLMASGRQGEYAPHRAPIGGGGRHLGERLSGAASRIGGAASSAASATRERLSSAAHRASEAASSGRERLGRGGERMSSAGGHLRERGAHLRERGAHMRGRASELGDTARQQASRAYESAREQPLLLGALGIAVGAALGALLPPTRQEDEWMGKLRDPLLERAREQVGEQLDKGRKIAEAAGDAAKAEASRQTGGNGASRDHAGGGQPVPGM